MLKFLSIILTVLGILSLTLILLLQKPILVNSQEELLDLTENQLVITSSQMTGERYLSNSKIIVLNTGIEVLCDFSCPYLINQNLTILGTYNNFLKPRIKALKILRAYN